MTSTATESALIDLDEINSTFAAELILFSWHKFQNSTGIEARITALNNISIGITTSLGNSVKENVYAFNEKDTAKYSHLRARVAAVLSRHMAPQWSPKGIVSLLLWAIALIALTPADLLLGPVIAIKSSVMKVFLSESNGLILLLVISLLHFLETLYILYLMTPIVKTTAARLLWAGHGLVFGLPVTQQAMLLSARHHRKGRK